MSYGLNFYVLPKQRAIMRNKAQLIGRAGITPEIKTFDSGKTKARFSLATSERYRDKNGEWQEETQWHNIVAWGKIAEVVQKVVNKGDEIALEGKIINRSYEDREGQKRYISEIVINELLNLEKKQKKEAEASA